MLQPIYNPFKSFSFNNGTCFLSGEQLTADEPIQVFAPWLIRHCKLTDKPFKLLDESITTYPDLKLPCATSIRNKCIEPLEKQIELAFVNGYQAVKELPSILLFQWIAKLMYGIIFNEIQIGMRQQAAQGESFTMSQAMVHKFGNLHLMLQSLMKPIMFEDRLPWTIEVFPIQNPTHAFSYRDEINTLTFSLKMNNFGIIACLQDNGTNKIYHQDILNKVDGSPLHLIQFEELCSRFFYSNYLFNRLPEYMVLPTNEAVYIEAMPLNGISNKPLFDAWQDKTYAQVLENFWRPWHIPIAEILKNPEKPLSYLCDTSDTLIPADALKL